MGQATSRESNYGAHGSRDKLAQIKMIHKRELKRHPSTIKAFAAWKQYILKSAYGDFLIDEDISDTVFIMGSMSDASFSARTFVEEEFTVEADIMVGIIDVPEESAIPIKGKPGFYHVRRYGIHYEDNLIGLAKCFLSDPRYPDEVLGILTRGFNQNHCLSGKALKELATFFGQSNDGRATRDLIAWMLKIDTWAVDVDVKREVNGPAVTLVNTMRVHEQHRLTASFDLVVSCRLSFWPPEAEEWICRLRQWPSYEVVWQITDKPEVHLVAKPSSELDDELSSEFRLTFVAEKRLIEEQTGGMKFTYYVFKILFYKYFKAEVDGKTLPSYLAKTLMFWLCEEIDPARWTDKDIDSNLRMLFERLFDWLEQRYIPNYFVPAINLLGNVSDALIEKATQIDIKMQLLIDPVGCLPQVAKKVISRLDFLEKITSNWGLQYTTFNNEFTGRVPPPSTAQFQNTGELDEFDPYFGAVFFLDH